MLIFGGQPKYVQVAQRDDDEHRKPTRVALINTAGGTSKARVFMVAVMCLIAMAVVISMNSAAQSEQNQAETIPAEDEDDTIMNMPTAEEEGDEEEDNGVTIGPLVGKVGANVSDREVEKLTGTCPQWSSEFARRYASQCGYWLHTFDAWESSLIDGSKKEVAYVCDNQAKCHGWGDRIAGMMSAFIRAVDLKRQFKISHDFIRKIFTPCLLGNKKSSASWANSHYHGGSSSCVTNGEDSCTKWNVECEANSIRSINTDRLCFGFKHCGNLMRLTEKKVTAANSLGCGMRAILELEPQFFTEKKFPFKIDTKTRMMTLREIQEFMQKHYVISIQMRLGDKTAFFHKDKIDAAGKKRLLRPFTCASTIESYLTGASRPISGLNEYEQDTPGTINGKKILWFLATDTYSYKVLADKAFGRKLIAFDFRPEHIGITARGEDDLAKEIAEWYVLGLGNKLVVNKNDEDTDIFKGRISGYAKTSWIYHLKHMVYDAGTCKHFPLPLDGTWSDVRAKGCGRSTVLSAHTKFDQNHLLPIRRANMTFPLSYVADGKLTHDIEAIMERPQ